MLGKALSFGEGTLGGGRVSTQTTARARTCSFPSPHLRFMWSESTLDQSGDFLTRLRRVLMLEFGTCSEPSTFNEFFCSLESLPRLRNIQVGLTPAPGGADSKALRLAFNELTGWKPEKPFASIRHWYSHPVFYSLASFCPNLVALGGLVRRTFILSRFIYSGAQPFPCIERLENVILASGIHGEGHDKLFSVFSGELDFLYLS